MSSADASDRAITLDELLDLERAVWRALVDGDSGADAAALDDDFLGLYPSGYATKDEHVDQLLDGPTVVSFELSDARSVAVAREAALLCYLATYRRPGASVDEQMWVSSLWQRSDDGIWRNTFSQDTPVSDHAVP